MPVFVSTAFSSSQSSVLEAIGLLTGHKMFNIELASIHRCEDDLYFKLRKIGCNYITHNFFPPTSGRLVLNIASSDEHIRQKSMKFIKRAIDFAGKIGASVYTIHPGFLIDPAGESRGLKNYDFNFSSRSLPVLPPDYSKCFRVFLRSVNEIASYVKDKSITVAIETQGSVSKKNFLLFSKPEDFSIFFRENKSQKIGINLNLGHLNLAANAWGFDKYELAKMLKPQIVAVEVSHNEGVEDNHQSLRADCWYMYLLKDDFFRKIPVIFEGRNLPLEEVIRSYTLLRGILE